MFLVKNRLEQLRQWMQLAGMQACIVPQTDPHLSEYVEDYDKVRTYFSGFTGSAGTLVVTLAEAGLWTDSRYYLQAEKQLQGTFIQLYKVGEPGVPCYVDWLVSKVGKGKVAANAYLFSHATWSDYAQKITLVHAPQLEDSWQERPALSLQPCRVYTGYAPAASDKIAQLRKAMRQKQVDACFFSALDDIAWLLNIRGNDIHYVPVVRSYLWVDQKQIKWWVDPQKIQSSAVQAYLSSLLVEVLPYHSIENDWHAIAAVKSVWIDANQLNERMYQLLSGHYAVVTATTWCAAQKTCKTAAEVKGIQEAMQYDAVAWVRSLNWLDEQLNAAVPITELDFQQVLLQNKAAMPYYQGESFAPIVGYGAHAAIVHYEASPMSNATILPQGFLLVDAGSHFRYGTTDVTRTIACGPLTAQQKKVYTLVLKGMIAVAISQFTPQTPAAQLDKLARKALQSQGLDYGHGTGHGVGVVLSVHEAGASLSPKSVKPLQAGMVLSDEPGCYLVDQFGVRIENMLLVQQDRQESMSFQTLTYIPLQCSAIDKNLLTETEITWVNQYHRCVWAVCQPYLTTKEFNWLKQYAYEI